MHFTLIQSCQVQYIIFLLRVHTETGMGTQNSKQSDLLIQIDSGDTLSQQLYDFKSQPIYSFQSHLVSPSYIINKEQGLTYSTQYHKSAIIKLQQYAYNHFKMMKLDPTQLPLWKIIQQSQQQLLKEGDIIKIGKVVLQVQQICKKRKEDASSAHQSFVFDTRRSRDNTQCLDYQLKQVKSVSGRSLKQQCRFCFENVSTMENPLVDLCKCTGSVKNVHFLCLKQWVSKNLNAHITQTMAAYSYLQVQCQLCKHAIDKQFLYNSKVYSLIDIEKGSQPCIILKTKQLDNASGKFRITVFIVKLQDQLSLKIGRNAHSQICLKDISVSRLHCILNYKKGRLSIIDKNSKFGTLVKMRGQLQFNSEIGVEFQFQSKKIKLVSQNTVINNCCCSNNDIFTLTIDNGNQNIQQLQTMPLRHTMSL